MINYTIIIPHKNTPKLLRRCLDSIPVRDDLQIVIVDDNSDPSIVDFNNFPGKDRKGVECHFAKEGKGAGYARNIGLEHAKGKWVLFADSDDFFNLGFEKIFDRYLESNSDTIYFNIDSVESDNIIKKSNRSLSKNSLFQQYKVLKDENLFRYGYPEPWGKMIRLSLIKEHNIKFDETKVANDYFFSIQVGFYSKNINIVNEKIYILTNREGSVSYSYANTKEKLITRIDVAERVELFLHHHNVILTPSPLRGLLVLLLKRSFRLFLRTINKLHKDGINVVKLLFQIINPLYYS